MKDHCNALRYYKNAYKVDKNKMDIFLNRGNLLFEAKEYNDAIIYYEYTIKIDLTNKDILLK